MKKQTKIPPGYKASPLGPIPNDWMVKELDDVVDFLDGKRKPIKDADRAKIQGIYPYYGASGVIDFVNDYIFDEELILLGEDGANIINRSSPLAFKVSGKIWVNNHAHVLKPKTGTDITYLTEFLESLKYDKYNTGTAQPKLNKEICSSIPVLSPPHKEQLNISYISNSWDKAIQTTKALIEQKQKRKKWLMQMLLSGKKRLKGFEKEKWKEVKLKEVFNEIKDVNDGVDGHNVMTISSKLGLISQEDKFDRVIAGDSLKKYTQLKKNDFAYNKGNSKTYKMGCIYQLEESESALVPFVYICFSPTKKVNPTFYKHWFFAHGLDMQLNRIITSGARGDGLLNVNTEDFFNLKVPYPELQEQKSIAEIMEVSNREIKILQNKLDKLKEQKKGLMQILLTGKKRLKI